MFSEGRQIGNYTLLSKLGKGGFGEVWLAEKRSQFVTKKVAVKLPHEDQVNFDAIHQEATLWEQASGHPNVLPIIDADIIDGQVLIVSEYADGGSLADRLKREGKLTLQQAVEMAIGILNGLEFLHNRQIIHRDIKPQNILLQGNTPRLADFGISRAMNTTMVSSTIIGTDAYMSPESFDGKRNVQTDIWSVGVVLYALLADKLPFPQEHPSERMFAILTKEFESLPADVPQNLQRIVAKSLAKQPEYRYQTTTEMRDELQKVLLGIAHPTFAPTEVFRLSTENLPPVPTLENRSETAETEREIFTSQQPFNFPAPTQAAFQPESVVTNFKETPPVTNESAFSASPPINKPQAAPFQMFGNSVPAKSQTLSVSISNLMEKNKELKYLIAIAAGLLMVTVIIFVIGYTRNNSVVSSLANVSNSSSISSSNTSPPNSPFPLNIQLTIRRDFRVQIFVDRKDESISSPMESIFTAYESFEIGYPRVFYDGIQLKINGKDITLPKDSGNGDSTIRFVITKDNYNRILQPGTNAGQMIVNTNAVPSFASNSASNTASNAVSNSTSLSNAANSVSDIPSFKDIRIELESSKTDVKVFCNTDDDIKAVVLNPGVIRKINSRNELVLTYDEVDAKSITLRINGKIILVPTTPNLGDVIRFDIKRENLPRIFREGRIPDGEGM